MTNHSNRAIKYGTLITVNCNLIHKQKTFCQLERLFRNQLLRHFTIATYLVVSAEYISSLITDDAHTESENVTIHCPHCHYEFSYLPQCAYGDPRNIALIGHWDGWQPYSTSIKHSCGMHAN